MSLAVWSISQPNNVIGFVLGNVCMKRANPIVPLTGSNYSTLNTYNEHIELTETLKGAQSIETKIIVCTPRQNLKRKCVGKCSRRLTYNIYFA